MEYVLKVTLTILLLSAVAHGYFHNNKRGQNEVMRKRNELIDVLKRLTESASGDDSRLESRARSELSPPERSAMVKRHNQLRRAEGGANMEMLQWSAELARKAQDLANTCVFEHAMMEWEGSTYPKCGQNLYIGGNRDYDEAIQAWYDEKYDYVYGTGCKPGKVCGHYTQLAWATTTEVGCGVHFCKSAEAPSFGTTFYDSYYFVCNYGPAGNMADELPFLTGAPCTECSGTSLWCKNELCASSGCSGNDCTCEANCQNGGELDRHNCACTCTEGFLGSDCSEICEDKHRSCGPMNGWPNTWCDDPNTPYVSENCPMMCGRCVPAGGIVCEDKNAYCNANPGWDETWCREDYVLYECPKMCGQC